MSLEKLNENEKNVIELILQTGGIYNNINDLVDIINIDTPMTIDEVKSTLINLENKRYIDKPIYLSDEFGDELFVINLIEMIP